MEGLATAHDGWGWEQGVYEGKHEQGEQPGLLPRELSVLAFLFLLRYL